MKTKNFDEPKNNFPTTLYLKYCKILSTEGEIYKKTQMLEKELNLK